MEFLSNKFKIYQQHLNFNNIYFNYYHYPYMNKINLIMMLLYFFYYHKLILEIINQVIIDLCSIFKYLILKILYLLNL